MQAQKENLEKETSELKTELEQLQGLQEKNDQLQEKVFFLFLPRHLKP